MQIDNRALKLFYAKDESTVSAIYSTYFGLLKHISFGVVHDMSLAEDCAQEAFLRAFSGNNVCKSPSAFLSYLCTCAKNASLDQAKKKKEEPMDEEISSEDRFRYGDELLDRLKEILLPDEFDALFMHYCLEMRFDEIAIALGTSPSGARGLAHRGKEKARAEMKKEEWL